MTSEAGVGSIGLVMVGMVSDGWLGEDRGVS